MSGWPVLDLWLGHRLHCVVERRPAGCRRPVRRRNFSWRLGASFRSRRGGLDRPRRGRCGGGGWRSVGSGDWLCQFRPILEPAVPAFGTTYCPPFRADRAVGHDIARGARRAGYNHGERESMHTCESRQAHGLSTGRRSGFFPHQSIAIALATCEPPRFPPISRPFRRARPAEGRCRGYRALRQCRAAL